MKPAMRSSVFSRKVATLSWALATLGLSCSCADTSPSKAQARSCPPDCGPAPLGSASASASAATAPDVVWGDPLEGPTFQAEKFVAVLDETRFAAAREAARRGDFTAAATAFQEVIGREGIATIEPQARAPYFYQLGRLRSLAGDLRGAAQAFDAAAALPFELADYARFAAASELFRAGDHDGALTRAQGVGAVAPLADDLELLKGDALRAKGDEAGAIKQYRAYLERGRPPQWGSVAVRLGRLLMKQSAASHADEVLRLARKVLHQGGGNTSDAEALQREAIAALPDAKKKKAEAPTLEERVDEAKARLSSGQTTTALKQIEALAKDKTLAKGNKRKKRDLACEVAALHGEALGKLRKRSEAAKAYATAAKACEGEAARAPALYNAGKMAFMAAKIGDAMTHFAELEKDYPKNRLADDARLKGARALLEQGEEAKALAKLETMAADYPTGDMVGDGIFEGALVKMEHREWADAITILEKGRARHESAPERAYHSAGRFHYYLARAHDETGNRAKADELYAAVVAAHPLSFYMALAYARLAERDAAKAKALVAAHEKRDAEDAGGRFVIANTEALRSEGFLRAMALARQGETRFAKAELEKLGVFSHAAPSEVQFAAAEVLARAGAFAPSHAIFRGATSGAPGKAATWEWATHYPTGKYRRMWELAFPQPYLDLVLAETKRSGIGTALAYGIMREESAFDPRVASAAAAYGLMQLIVPTAERMATPLGLPFDEQSLRKPEINVALGCRYLGELRAKYPEAPLLAIPAYNSGDGRPRQWITARPNHAFDLWVERIPFEETRNYTKRVLQSMAAYEYLGGAGLAGEAMKLPVTPLSSPAGASPKAAEPAP